MSGHFHSTVTDVSPDSQTFAAGWSSQLGSLLGFSRSGSHAGISAWVCLPTSTAGWRPGLCPLAHAHECSLGSFCHAWLYVWKWRMAAALNSEWGGVQVEAVYRRCGFDVDPSASTLQMLTNIEMRLEDYLRHVAALPEDFWEAQEKAREKERRHQARDAKIQATKEARPRLPPAGPCSLRTLMTWDVAAGATRCGETSCNRI